MAKYMFLVVVAGGMMPLHADGNSASASATAGVRIVAPVKVTAIQNLDFGAIVVTDVKKPASLTMAFDGILPGASGNLTGSLAPSRLTGYSNCTPYAKGTSHAPALVQFQKDAWVAGSSNLGTSGLFDMDVTVSWDHVVTLTGGYGPPVSLKVATDLPADPFAPAGAVPGVIYRRFQIAGTLSIPAESLGSKTGLIHVSVAYN